MNTQLPPMNPLPHRHAGRGQIQDANGLPVAWVCHDQAFGWTAEAEALAELYAHAPKLLATVARFALMFNTHFRTFTETDLPPEFYTLAGEMIGVALVAGVEPSAITPGGKGGGS